jgi:hypothetical protein
MFRTDSFHHPAALFVRKKGDWLTFKKEWDVDG